MVGTPEQDHPRRDLVEAVRVVMARDGHLLSAGELVVLRRFLGLEAPAQSLFARLLLRRHLPIAVDSLSYADVPEPSSTAELLVAEGFAWDEGRLPVTPLLRAHTVDELKRIAAAVDLSRSGRKETLVAGLSQASGVRAQLLRRLVLHRHRGLFRRIGRLFLHDHSGDLSRLTTTRIEIIRWPVYEPTGGHGMFEHRRALLSYEAATRRLAAAEEAEVLGPFAEPAVMAVEATPPPADFRRRLCSRALDEALALAAIRELERGGDQQGALLLYQRLLAVGIRKQEHAARRAALCLEALGRAAEGSELCTRFREAAPPAAQRALDRTGRRLARRAGRPWTPLPPLPPISEREIDLALVDHDGTRPTWDSPHGPATVEQSLGALLAQLGRTALHAETRPWTTLFGLLLRPALFAPIEGMLPTPMLSGPLDLGTPGFLERRRGQVETILDDIAWGGGPALLAQALDAYDGEAIVGVRVDETVTADHLCALVDAAGGPALAAILGWFAEDYRRARRGFPDLVVLPGDEVRLPRALPARVPDGLVLAEVKGPGDALSDIQRVWLGRLDGLGVRAEVWRVRAVPDRV